MKKLIDLNADVGENPSAIIYGSERKLISLISSANIACGGHAGDEVSMTNALELCAEFSVNIGAHPSYTDRVNFGRKELNFSLEEISKMVFDQVLLLVKLADKMKLKLKHIKPHGAMYNSAAKNELIAKAISDGIKKINRNFILYGLANSTMLDVWRNEGFEIVGEAFADRRYEIDGTLRKRKFSDALITNPKKAAEQVLSIVKHGKVLSVTGEEVKISAQTICIHSDTENSLLLIEEIKKTLQIEGFSIGYKN